MNKSEYSLLLKSDEWKSKRLIILRRDNFKCQKCNDKNNLHVHHKKYISGKMPWEVPNNLLITLCCNCHAKEHEGRHISSFAQKKKPKNKVVITKKKKGIDKRKELYKTLSKYDLKIQLMYDKLRLKKHYL